MKKITIITLLLMVAVLLLAEQPKVRQLRKPQTHSGSTRREMPSQRWRNFGKEGRLGNMQMHLLEKLELTDKQKEQIDDLKLQNRLAIIELQADLKKITLMRHKYMADSDFNNAKKSVTEYHEKRTEIATKQIELAEKIYNLLDKKQQEAYRKICRNPLDCTDCKEVK